MSMARGYVCVRILAITLMLLIGGMVCSWWFVEYKSAYSQFKATDSALNTTSNGNRLVNRAPGYQGSIFADQITLGTDKETYKPGELINLTITNAGTRPVHFSTSDSKIEIKNTRTNETFLPSTLLIDKLIPSGSFISIIWNQQDFTGKQVNDGIYLAQATVGRLNTSTTFTIK